MASIDLSAKATQTVPVSVATYAQQYEVRYGEMAAGSLVSFLGHYLQYSLIVTL